MNCWCPDCAVVSFKSQALKARERAADRATRRDADRRNSPEQRLVRRASKAVANGYPHTAARLIKEFYEPEPAVVNKAYTGADLTSVASLNPVIATAYGIGPVVTQFVNQPVRKAKKLKVAKQRKRGRDLDSLPGYLDAINAPAHIRAALLGKSAPSSAGGNHDSDPGFRAYLRSLGPRGWDQLLGGNA